MLLSVFSYKSVNRIFYSYIKCSVVFVGAGSSYEMRIMLATRQVLATGFLKSGFLHDWNALVFRVRH